MLEILERNGEDEEGAEGGGGRREKHSTACALSHSIKMLIIGHAFQ